MPVAILFITLIAVLSSQVSAMALSSTQLWEVETVAIAKVGENSDGASLLRRIILGVVAPVPTAANENSLRRCIKSAFNGDSPPDRLGTKLRSAVDAAFSQWDDFTLPTPQSTVLNNADTSENLFNTEETIKQGAFVKSINSVTEGLRDIDQVFRSRLVAKAECNPLLNKTFLVLVQRLCPTVPANCGAILGTEASKALVVGNRYVNRFEMLLAWARITQGPDKSLLTSHTPVLVGPSARTTEALDALSAFKDTGYSGADPVILEPKPEESQEALERFILNEQRKGRRIQGGLSSIVLAVLKVPLETGVRLAEHHLLSHAQFGLTQLKSAPNATFMLLSDEVARSRLFNCVHLSGITNRDLEKLKACAGYEIREQELIDCLQKKPCKPVIRLTTRGTKEIQGTFQQLTELRDSTIYPRLRTGDVAFSTLADLARTECGRFSGGGEQNPDLAKCLLGKTLINPEKNALATCLVQVRANDKEAYDARGHLTNALDCLGPASPAFAKNVGEAKKRLGCLEAQTSLELQTCLLDVQLPPEQKRMWECLKQKRDISDRIECYLTSLPGSQPASVAACASDPAKRIDCLRALLPAGAQRAAEINQACRSAANAGTYLTCAKSLGLAVDPKVSDALECGSKATTWTSAASCLASKKIDGPAGQIAACVADGQAAAPSAIAACVVGRALGFNEDLQMLAQCATVSGGEPISTASCTFGKVALRELAFCTGQKFGEGNCFGDNNTLRRALDIKPGSTVAQLVNFQLDVVNGAVSFTQKPGDTVEATLRNAGRELTIVRNNVYAAVDKAGDDIRSTLSTALGPGVYVKVDPARGIEAPGVKIPWRL